MKTKSLLNTLNSKIEFDKEQKEYIRQNLYELFMDSCKSGYKNLAEYLYNLHKTENVNQIVINDGGSYSDLFRYTCAHGQKEIAEWLYNLSKAEGDKIDINGQNDSAFIWTCEGGHIETAKWLYDLSKIDGNKKININVKRNKAFKMSCINGHIEMAKVLCELDKTCGNKKIKIDKTFNETFIEICSKGKTQSAEFLYNLSKIDGNIKININIGDKQYDKDSAFIRCCINNHTETAIFLYKLSKSDNNEPLDDYSFRTAIHDSCWYGYIDRFEWLYAVGLKIEDFIDDDLISACYERRFFLIPTLNFLCKLCPQYSFIENDDNLIPMKNDKKIE